LKEVILIKSGARSWPPILIKKQNPTVVGFYFCGTDGTRTRDLRLMKPGICHFEMVVNIKNAASRIFKYYRICYIVSLPYIR